MSRVGQYGHGNNESSKLFLEHTKKQIWDDQ